MNQDFKETNDLRLRELLRGSYPAPPLGSGFREGVWRRIELTETRREMPMDWLDRLAGYILRPRLALAGGIVLLVLGTSLGLRDGLTTTRQTMQERYLTAVSPPTFYH